MTILVVDTSAVVAILGNESAANDIIEALDVAEDRLISAATLVELGMVMEARLGAAGALAVDRFLRDGEVNVVAVDRQQADRALDGWRRYGKGRACQLSVSQRLPVGQPWIRGCPLRSAGPCWPADRPCHAGA